MYAYRYTISFSDEKGTTTFEKRSMDPLNMDSEADRVRDIIQRRMKKGVKVSVVVRQIAEAKDAEPEPLPEETSDEHPRLQGHSGHSVTYEIDAILKRAIRNYPISSQTNFGTRLEWLRLILYVETSLALLQERLNQADTGLSIPLTLPVRNLTPFFIRSCRG